MSFAHLEWLRTLPPELKRWDRRHSGLLVTIASYIHDTRQYAWLGTNGFVSLLRYAKERNVHQLKLELQQLEVILVEPGGEDGRSTSRYRLVDVVALDRFRRTGLWGDPGSTPPLLLPALPRRSVDHSSGDPPSTPRVLLPALDLRSRRTEEEGRERARDAPPPLRVGLRKNGRSADVDASIARLTRRKEQNR